MTVIKVGTRQSRLALAQTEQVVDHLKRLHPDISFELVPYKTEGDRLNRVSLQEIGGKGVFVKDIEKALLNKEIDIAVHSLKDMPALIAEGCTIGAVPEREDIRDCLIFRDASMSFEKLPAGAVIGTSSQRRQVQLQEQRPDLIFRPLRGNIDTRLQKLQNGDYEAIVLAMAGLNRMGWTRTRALHIEPLSAVICLPAVSQGALGIECRLEDSRSLELLAPIHHQDTADCVSIERSVLALMNADCTFPIGALATKSAGGYRLEAMLANERGKCLRTRLDGREGRALAEEAVSQLINLGGIGAK